MAGSYVENDRQSYRQTAKPGGQGTEYQTPPGSSDDDVHDNLGLHHTTIWCFLAWLGSQSAALTVGRQQVQQHHPGSTCHRFLGAVAPQKFRSPQREQRLRTSRQLLHLITEWEGLFPHQPFFPRFATRSGFT
ncbi:MAG: hypothetical protein FJZ96_13625 [Chloroflexi bacterium]|nr:hypothetical protein [Chloroflexota bacterium]